MPAPSVGWEGLGPFLRALLGGIQQGVGGAASLVDRTDDAALMEAEGRALADAAQYEGNPIVGAIAESLGTMLPDTLAGILFSGAVGPVARAVPDEIFNIRPKDPFLYSQFAADDFKDLTAQVPYATKEAAPRIYQDMANRYHEWLHGEGLWDDPGMSSDPEFFNKMSRYLKQQAARARNDLRLPGQDMGEVDMPYSEFNRSASNLGAKYPFEGPVGDAEFLYWLRDNIRLNAKSFVDTEWQLDAINSATESYKNLAKTHGKITPEIEAIYNEILEMITRTN